MTTVIQTELVVQAKPPVNAVHEFIACAAHAIHFVQNHEAPSALWRLEKDGWQRAIDGLQKSQAWRDFETAFHRARALAEGRLP